MERLVVFGAGGHAKVVLDALQRCGIAPAALYDDDVGRWGETCLGCQVVGGRQSLFATPEERRVIVAIARNDIRQRLAVEFVERGYRLEGVVHPSAVVSVHAEIAPTAQLMAGVIVNPGAKVGAHAVLNSGCIVDHDCVIGEFTHIGPGATLAGAVEVSEGAFLGTRACVKPSMRIGAWSTVGAGAAVIGSVPNGRTVVGVPARVLR